MRKKKEVIQQNIEEEKPSFKSRLFKAIFNRKSFATCLIILGFVFAYGLYSFYIEDVQNFSFKVAALLLGKLFFALPIMLWVIGLKLLLGKKFTWTKAGIIGNFLLLVCGLGICHKIFDPQDVSAVKNYMEGGGVFGYFIVKGIIALVGESILWVVLAVGLWIGLAFLMPVSTLAKIWNWFKGFFGSKKTHEDEDDYEEPAEPKIKQSFKAEPKKIDAQPINSSASFPMARDSGFTNTNQGRRAQQEGLDPRDIYHREEFNSFSDGIDKKPVYKKFLDFGKSNPYKDIKEEIHEDPVQLPEWEENPKEHLPWPEDLPEGVEPWDADKRNLAQEKILRWEDIVEENEAKQPEAGTTDEGYAIGSSSKTGSVIVNYYESKKSPKDEEVSPAQAELVKEEEAKASASKESKAKEITIEDSADKIEGEVLTEAEAKAREEKKKTPPKKKSKYVKPPVNLLNPPVKADRASWEAGVKEQCELLEKTLADFKVRARVINVTRGPSVTRFELEPAPGVKVASIVNLADDIALRLAAPGVRIEAPIPGKSAVGIEAPNIKNDMVAFREVVDTDVVKKDPSRLAIGLGKNISGTIISADLGKMPHTLIAGSTGSGKSVCVNTIIAGLLYKADPDEVKLILVDPKVVELSNYNGIPHLLTPVVTDPKKAASALRWGVNEMERRYQLFADNHVREITSYNKKEDVEKLPYIVIIIDELADLMMVAKVDVEEAILRLAQKARACGIHLILATQRPSVDVITGIVKANIPSRIAFAVSSQTDSRTILDGSGAEKLLGKGDMLFKPVGVNTAMRVQGAFVTDEELAKIVDFVKNQGIETEYNEEVTKVELSSDKEKPPAAEANPEAGGDSETDALFEDALRLVLDTGQVSSSMLQRRFRIGYTRAARLVDTFEELGIVGQSVGAKPREVIMSRQEAEERFLNN